MATLTQDMVHYTKFSLAEWNGKQERYRVNQSLKTISNPKMLQFTWAFTRDSYELQNGLRDQGDENWSGFIWAAEEWKTLRKQYKQDIILWVAKACHKKNFKPGHIQPNVRVPQTVSLMYYIPSQNVLFQTTKMDDWTIDFQYHDVDHKVFNMIYDWRNPTTSVQGGTAPGGW